MTRQFLSEIVDVKKREIEILYENGLESLKDIAELLPQKRSFQRMLSYPGLSLIAELKKASPSKGLINPYFDPVELAMRYERMGARCLSVLTETEYFKGNPSYIERVLPHVGLPILRKDFILDPIQVYESKCLKADCMLLIKALLSDDLCQELLSLAASLELDVIVEVHDRDELDAVLSMDHVTIIGINNRNLKTFEVDIKTALELAPVIQNTNESIKIVAESGYSRRDQLEELVLNGFHAVLIGEGLVTHPDLLDYFS